MFVKVLRKVAEITHSFVAFYQIVERIGIHESRLEEQRRTRVFRAKKISVELSEVSRVPVY